MAVPPHKISVTDINPERTAGSATAPVTTTEQPPASVIVTELSYSQFVVPLVKAVQEQELKIEELNIELGKQKQINAEKDRLLSELLKRIEIIELKLK